MRQLCTFTIEDTLLGIDVLKVQEVVREQAVTRVPLAPPAVVGLVNLRGQLVPAISLRRRMDRPDLEPGRRPTGVVVTTDDGPIDLLVDDIGDVTEISDELFQEPPKTLRDPMRKLVKSVCRLPDRVLLLLDVDRAVNL